MTETYRLLPCADRAVTVEFGNTISEENSAKVAAFTARMNQFSLAGIEEIIPTYRSVTICFDPEVLSFSELFLSSRIFRALRAVALFPILL